MIGRLRMADVYRTPEQAVQGRRNRRTGTIIEVWRAVDLGLGPDDGPWLTMCLGHGTVVHHNTRRLAVAWAAEPDVWCDGCREVIEERGGDGDER